MGINTKKSAGKSPKQKKADPKERLERDLRSCMRCKFFYGNNNRCINNKKCSGKMTDREKAAHKERKNSECYNCPYGKGKAYCFPCVRKLMGK